MTPDFEIVKMYDDGSMSTQGVDDGEIDDGFEIDTEKVQRIRLRRPGSL